MSKSIIKIQDVWKIYTMGEVEVAALRGLNLEVKKGDKVPELSSTALAENTFNVKNLGTGQYVVEDWSFYDEDQDNAPIFEGVKLIF